MAALCSALKNKRFYQAKLLIDMGIDVNARDPDKRTALMEICFLEEESKAAKIAKLLLENGAKVGLKDKKGMTALSYACKFGREQLVGLMIDEAHMFDPNSSDTEGNTALHYAASSGNFVVLNSLIKTLNKLKLSVDKFNKRGETPLICASKAGHFLCARILISEGKASKQARDKVCFKTASEWEKTEESIRCASKSPLFMTLQLKMSGEDSPRGSLDVDQNKAQKTRPHTAPVKGTLQKTHRDNLRKLFEYYQGQLTGAFRPGIKPKPVIIEPETSEDTTSESSDFSETLDFFPASGLDPKSLLNRRFSVARTANNILNTNSAFRRRSIATAGLSPSQNRRLSLASSGDSRRGSQSSPSPKIRRGSINVIAKLNVSPQQPKQNIVPGKSRRGSYDVRNKALDVTGNRPLIRRSQSPVVNKLMHKLQTLDEASDDETEEDEILQRSSPAALKSVTILE